MRELVELEPDGVVCGNDLTAAHLMRALIGMGVRVPEQIRLVSFDDVSYAKFLPVPLTTIHQNCPQIGEFGDGADAGSDSTSASSWGGSAGALRTGGARVLRTRARSKFQ